MTTRRRVFLDENMPTRLRLWLPSVGAVTAEYMGWKGVFNGDLIQLVLAHHFEVFVTADGPLVRDRRSWSPLGCVYLTLNHRAPLRAAAAQIDRACCDVIPGQVLTIRL